MTTTPKKKDSKASPPKQSSKAFRGFVNIRLTDEDIQQIPVHIEINALTEDIALDDLLAAGFKVSFTMNSDGVSTICTATGTDRADEGNQGYAMSAFGDTWFDALFAMHYKICRVLGAATLDSIQAVLPVKRRYG